MQTNKSLSSCCWASLQWAHGLSSSSTTSSSTYTAPAPTISPSSATFDLALLPRYKNRPSTKLGSSSFCLNQSLNHAPSTGSWTFCPLGPSSEKKA
ncbi:hypothetical protein KCU68_g235, partial [Aureobasidium melanogenum]